MLDGYDFGVGILSPLVTINETERSMVRATIGHVWPGNEVWLIAGSALLFLAFPKAYAAVFSGFYLALIIVLWLLIGRGLAFELRGHVAHGLWRGFWDAIFTGSSLLLAFSVGLFAGNVSRGVPLNEEAYFFLPLWTDLQPGARPGLLDWFTILTGVTMVVLLALHGATYLAMQTVGPLQTRCRTVAKSLTVPAAIFLSALYMAWPIVQPAVQEHDYMNSARYAWSWASAATLALLYRFHLRDRMVAAFACSSLLVASLLVTIVWGTYPNLLTATDPANSVTITGAAAEPNGLRAALWWVPPGLALVVVYQVLIHRMFAGPVTPETLYLYGHEARSAHGATNADESRRASRHRPQ